jgi:hypothetical protein
MPVKLRRKLEERKKILRQVETPLPLLRKKIKNKEALYQSIFSKEPPLPEI